MFVDCTATCQHRLLAGDVVRKTLSVFTPKNRTGSKLLRASRPALNFGTVAARVYCRTVRLPVKALVNCGWARSEKRNRRPQQTFDRALHKRRRGPSALRSFAILRGFTTTARITVKRLWDVIHALFHGPSPMGGRSPSSSVIKFF